MNIQNHLVSRQSGLTLVELMVGLAVGMLLLLGVGLLFSQNKQSFIQNDALARLQEEARFALEELGRDLSMAGFMGEIVDSTILSLTEQAVFEDALGPQKNCGPTASARNWFYDFTNGIFEDSIRAGDNQTGAQAAALFSCIDAATFQAGTDVVGIKRTGGVPSGMRNLTVVPPIDNPAPNGRVYIRENGSRGELYQSPGAPAVPQPFNEWEYTPRIYYVRNFAVTAGDGIPTLCRVRLINDGVPGGVPPNHREECIAQGVEDMQLEFGLDTNDDGAANVYVTDPTVQDLTRTVSVRIYLLMRTLNLDVGYLDNRSYALSNKPAYTPADRFHRRIYSSTVVVRNVNTTRQLDF